MLSVNKILFKDTNEKSADSDIKIPMVAEWFSVFILSVNKILCADTLSVNKILCTDTLSVNKHFLYFFIISIFLIIIFADNEQVLSGNHRIFGTEQQRKLQVSVINNWMASYCQAGNETRMYIICLILFIIPQFDEVSEHLIWGKSNL